MEPVVKRRPGRPPKASKAPPVTKYGIVKEAADKNNRFELSHSKPVLWKNMFSFFQSHKAVDIVIKCSPDGLTFYTSDYTRNINIMAMFDVSQMEWFYCEKEIYMGVNQQDVEGIFKIIDDSFCRIMIEQLRSNPTQIKITFSDPSIKKENTFQVNVMFPPADPMPNEMDTFFSRRGKSDIIFTLTNRHLKKSMDIASKHSPVARMECIGDGNLNIIYDSKNCQVSGREIYRDKDAIKFQRNAKNAPYVQVQFQIALVKTFTDANKFDNVKVHGSNGGAPLIMVTESSPLQICSVINTD